MGNITSKSRTVSDPSAFATLVQPRNLYNVDDENKWKTYDYVIVGGGTAGCVLASRLSEDPDVTVLLIEAGKTNEGHFMSHMPLGFTQMFKTAYDWAYETLPQQALRGRTIYWPRGKILGGSSAINALIYHHCAPEDYDEWEREGAKGWSYETMRKYFNKAEHYTSHPSFPELDNSNRSTEGPWKITHTEVAPITHRMLEACEEVGIPMVHDLNTPEGTLGAAPWVGTIDQRNGTRSSSATAYLTPAVLSRPNLTVATNITVEKILFSTTSESSSSTSSHKSDTSPQAIGVQLAQNANSPRWRVGANKEVVLCAGAIGTPQLLLLSGIGPVMELKGMGIEIVKDLPFVGKNLLDHYSCGELVFRAKSGTTWDYIMTPWGGLYALLQYLLVGKGPLSCLGSQAGVFVRSDDDSLPFTGKSSGILPVADHTAGPNSPDIEFIFVPFIGLDHGFKTAPWGSNGVTFGSLLLKPESQGTITLKSKSAFDSPFIDAKYLSTEHDINILVKATRLMMRIAHTEPLASYLDLKKDSSDESDFFYPGDADPDRITDDDIKAWIRRNGHSSWHPTSSAKMGASSDTSVVDPELRVHGVRGLRVMDASVFPTMVSGHPCAVIIAMAERAADLIKGSAKESGRSEGLFAG